MDRALALDAIGRLPMPDDNVAVAVRRLDEGTRIACGGTAVSLSHTVLEGHRFAVRTIPAGEALLSWGLPFGTATRAIQPGDYVCNPQILEALRIRRLDFELPRDPNFEDRMEPYILEEVSFEAGTQVPPSDDSMTFQGYRRAPSRGVGTRNHIVVIGTSSRTESFARILEQRFKGRDASPDADAVVAVAHTEGGGTHSPSNREYVLRVLAGLMVHPNVGAVLAVDTGDEPLNNAALKSYMEHQGYPLGDVHHRFLSLQGGFERSLQEAAAVIGGWMEPVRQTARVEAEARDLKVALQCGGSDAFSGISGNPLAAWVAREVIRHGGSANLAETDELIGAEPHILRNVKDLSTARQFLAAVQRYKDLAAWHGTTAEGNPSGGNKLRGLYNIALKSLGAAMKRHPDVRIDRVIDYAEPMVEAGYTFMHSPGNDLESIAGQVAAGSNLIMFVTGNGAITNFPFVPTVKILTTTPRYDLLASDMDVNAGAYLDGEPMDELGRRTLDLVLQVASGTRTKGEKAGHTQVSIWREWKQTGGSGAGVLDAREAPQGAPIPVPDAPRARELTYDGYPTCAGPAIDRFGLVMPTSLCSAEIARMAADRLNEREIGRAQGISRFVALPHTEGCGVGGETAEVLFNRALLGYLTHPCVQSAVVMEHGCEKTHNDYVRLELEAHGIDPETFGWVSVQLDGGIQRALEKTQAWFTDRLEQAPSPPPARESLPISGLRVGLLSAGALDEGAATAMARLTLLLAGAGCLVVVPETATFLDHPELCRLTPGGERALPTLAHAQRAQAPGLHVMEAQTDHWAETVGALGATGAEILLAGAEGEHPLQGHPMLPTLQASAGLDVTDGRLGDFDLVLGRDPEEDAWSMLRMLTQTASGVHVPRAAALGNTSFQISRGLLGVSM